MTIYEAQIALNYAKSCYETNATEANKRALKQAGEAVRTAQSAADFRPTANMGITGREGVDVEGLDAFQVRIKVNHRMKNS